MAHISRQGYVLRLLQLIFCQPLILTQTVVGINAYVIQRDKSIFGEDADGFRPERWFEENKGAMERCFTAVSGD